MLCEEFYLRVAFSCLVTELHFLPQVAGESTVPSLCAVYLMKCRLKYYFVLLLLFLAEGAMSTIALYENVDTLIFNGDAVLDCDTGRLWDEETRLDRGEGPMPIMEQ